MTKSHIFIYALTVLGITIGAYLYTSTVEAPHGLTYQEAPLAPSGSDVVETREPTPLPEVTEVTETTVPTDVAVVHDDLTAKSWTWIYTEDVSGNIKFTPKRSEAFKMQFTEDRMSSATDCNTMGGSFIVEGQNLSFGPLMSTLMYCDGSDEAVYSLSLGSTSSYEIKEEKLRLTNTVGEVMVFTATE